MTRGAALQLGNIIVGGRSRLTSRNGLPAPGSAAHLWKIAHRRVFVPYIVRCIDRSLTMEAMSQRPSSMPHRVALISASKCAMDCRGRQGHGYPEDAPDPGAQGRGFVSMLAGMPDSA
jgi:hypothetical protein